MSLFLNAFFCEKTILGIFKDSEKIQIFVVRARLLIYSNHQYVLNVSFTNDTLLMVITIKHTILSHGVYMNHLKKHCLKIIVPLSNIEI